MYPYLSEREKKHWAEHRVHNATAAGLWEALNDKLDDEGRALLRAFDNAKDQAHLSEIELHRTRLERLLPDRIDIVRPVYLEGCQFDYDDVKPAPAPAPAKPQSVAEAEAELEDAEALAAGLLDALRAALPEDHRDLALKAENAYSDREQANLRLHYARLRHLRPDLDILFRLAFTPPEHADHALADFGLPAEPATA